MVDMTFIHRLEDVALTVLRRNRLNIPRHAQYCSEHEIEAIRFCKKFAQELYFQLDASMLINLAIYKLAEKEEAPPILAHKAVA